MNIIEALLLGAGIVVALATIGVAQIPEPTQPQKVSVHLKSDKIDVMGEFIKAQLDLQ